MAVPVVGSSQTSPHRPMNESDNTTQRGTVDQPDDEPLTHDITAVATTAEEVIDNVGGILVGHRDTVEHVLIAVLARGHVMLEDVPGVGKTMLSKALAGSIDCSFRRIQFTPDLLPSDITGVNVFNQKTQSFEFQPGPIFANIVLGDEINRAPPKTQSAMLEAMEEQQVTIDGITHQLPHPFTVMATRNIVEPHRTYELPIAELDRFMKTVKMGYPSERQEIELLERVVGDHPIEELEPVIDTEGVRDAQIAVSNVTIEEPIRLYATKLATRTRKRADLGASPRGTIALLRASQARAAINGRDYVIPDDVKDEAVNVLAHRVRPTLEDSELDGTQLVKEALDDVPIP